LYNFLWKYQRDPKTNESTKATGMNLRAGIRINLRRLWAKKMSGSMFHLKVNFVGFNYLNIILDTSHAIVRKLSF